jgi:uncharacterized protein VirK/YbjX
MFRHFRGRSRNFFRVLRGFMSVLAGPGIKNPQTESTAKRSPFHPARWAHFAWGLCSNFRTQFQILRFLTEPLFLGSVRANPALPFRYLNRNYLVRHLTITQRARCLLFHYQRIRALLPSPILRQVLSPGLTVYETCRDASLFRVTLGLSREGYWEGELSLHLEVDGVTVYTLSFSIVPGSIAGVRADEVLFVARIQGEKGTENEVRLATKSLLDVAPPALLFAALQGVAVVLRIPIMAGTSATLQSSYLPEFSSSFQEAYDDFFATLGATKNSAGFFFSPLPVKEKPLAIIPKGHKIRSRKKREFKRQVADSVAQSLFKID